MVNFFSLQKLWNFGRCNNDSSFALRRSPPSAPVEWCKGVARQLPLRANKHASSVCPSIKRRRDRKTRKSCQVLSKGSLTIAYVDEMVRISSKDLHLKFYYSI